MDDWSCVRCITVLLLLSHPQTISSFGERNNNIAHIMDLYKGLLSSSYSDIVIAIDSGEGVKKVVFDEMRNLSEMAVQCLSHVKQTRIAIISFSDKVKVLHTFKDCQESNCLADSLRRLRVQKGRRATARALREAKKILKRDGERKRKWTVVLITFGAPRIGRKRTYVVSQRLKKAGADMYVLGVGRRAFKNYESLKRIVRPFEATKKKTLHRLFLFRGPQHRKNFIMTKTVLKIGMQHYICANGERMLSSMSMLG